MGPIWHATSLAAKGNTVAAYNRTYTRTADLIENYPEASFVANEKIEDFVASLAKPRTAIVMVQAGAGADAVISELSEPGDIIVDGGNSRFTDTPQQLVRGSD
jgi:6-phosphogluconate dehydrogenase